MSLPLPNLYILGAEKCGTTAMYAFLDSHPMVCMARPKEPVFYECRYELGPEYYSRTYFSHYAGEPVIGEARHRNLYLPYVPDRILATTPQAKFIILLRPPDHRAYSAWINRVIRGYESLDFKSAIDADLARIRDGLDFCGHDGPALWCSGQDPAVGSFGLQLTSRLYRTYLDVGYYNVQLRRYLARFPARNMLILSTEEMLHDADIVMAKIADFLGLGSSSGFTAPLLKKNVTRNKDNLTKVMRRLGMINGWHWLCRNTMHMDYLHMVNDQTRRYLKTHYQPYMEDLEILWGRSLRHWWIS